MGQFFSQPSLAAGEISPDLYGRVDQELYYIGARRLKNFIVRQYGGASNRSGSKFISEAKDSSKELRIIDFSFNEIQTYVLALGDQTMRVIKDGGEVLEASKVITGITQANPAVVTSAAHGFSNGDDVYLAGIVGMVELNGRTLRVANVTPNTFELQDFQNVAVNALGYGAYVSGGTVARVYTVATPWPDEELFSLNYAQSNDVITFVHSKYQVYDVTRTDHNAWTVTPFNIQNGPFKDVNTTATTVIASAVTGAAITVTASAATFTADDVGSLFYIEQMPTDSTAIWEVGKTIALNDIRRAGYHYYKALGAGTTGTIKPDHVEGTSKDGSAGIEWEYLHSGYGIVKITAFTDTTHVTAQVIKRLPENTTTLATTNWAKALWSKTEGYPSAAAYHKQRLWLGGATLSPNTLACSGVRLRVQFGTSKPILDDEAIKLSLDTSNALRHILPLKKLIVLTSGDEELLSGQNGSILASEPPTPEVQGYNGSSKIRPIIIGNSALFVEDTLDVVRSLSYDYVSDAFKGLDVTARSPHLFRDRSIKDWAYQKRPLSTVWTVMDDGALLSFTFMEEQKVYAWSPHDTDGLYKSACCVREGSETAAYKVVERVINGTTRKYIERDQGRYFTSIEDAYFVDCGLSYDGRNTGATTITVSGGTTWTEPEQVTLTASASIFTARDTGDQIFFDAGNIRYRIEINGYISGTQVTGVLLKDLPEAYQDVARTDWRFARRTFSNFHHLEGKDVVALVDGNVVTGLTVEDGRVVIPTLGAVVHIGLRYSCELETLDFAQPQGQGKAHTINIPRVFFTVQDTRGIFVATNSYGDSSLTATDNLEDALYDDGFIEHIQRTPDEGYDGPIPAKTDLVEVGTNSSWSNTGRVCVRHIYPLPCTINGYTAEVQVGAS